MDPGQILWTAPYPPYLQAVFFQNFQFSKMFTIFFFVFVSMGPYGSKKNSKPYSSFYPILTKLYYKKVVMRELKVIVYIGDLPKSKTQYDTLKF